MRPSVLARIAILMICIPAAAHAAASGSEATKPDVAALAWMAGTWSGVIGSVTMEEHWMAPADGLMLGIHRDLRSGKPPFFEFLRIEAKDDGLFYLASPRGREATPFKMLSVEGRKVVFENPEHDFPQRIVYWLEGEDTLHARIEGTNEGQPRSSEWAWKRVK